MQSGFLVFRCVECRHEDHRYVASRRVVTQCGQNMMAVHVGHHDIQQDQVRLRRQQGITQGGRTTASRTDFDPGLTNDFADRRQVERLIVDDQYHLMLIFVRFVQHAIHVFVFSLQRPVQVLVSRRLPPRASDSLELAVSLLSIDSATGRAPSKS